MCVCFSCLDGLAVTRLVWICAGRECFLQRSWTSTAIGRSLASAMAANEHKTGADELKAENAKLADTVREQEAPD